MLLFKDENNLVYSYEDTNGVLPNYIPITELEAESLRFPKTSTVTMRQARLALHQTGVLPRVINAIINSSEEDKITWEYSTEVNKTDPVVQRIATGLNLTPTELDDLFNLASTL